MAGEDIAVSATCGALGLSVPLAAAGPAGWLAIGALAMLGQAFKTSNCRCRDDD
jgi:hypothetical protein